MTKLFPNPQMTEEEKFLLESLRHEYNDAIELHAISTQRLEFAKKRYETMHTLIQLRLEKEWP